MFSKKIAVLLVGLGVSISAFATTPCIMACTPARTACLLKATTPAQKTVCQQQYADCMDNCLM